MGADAKYLESLGQDDITVTYLHHLLILKTGPTKEREIFDKVRQLVNSQGACPGISRRGGGWGE